MGLIKKILLWASGIFVFLLAGATWIYIASPQYKFRKKQTAYEEKLTVELQSVIDNKYKCPTANKLDCLMYVMDERGDFFGSNDFRYGLNFMHIICGQDKCAQKADYYKYAILLTQKIHPETFWLYKKVQGFDKSDSDFKDYRNLLEEEISMLISQLSRIKIGATTLRDLIPSPELKIALGAYIQVLDSKISELEKIDVTKI